MFSSFSRPGLSELPARADFYVAAVDLVDPTPEPPLLRWVNPEAAELAVLGAQVPDGASKIGSTINVPKPARFKSSLYLPPAFHFRNQAKIDTLRAMQRDCPSLAGRIQDQIDALLR